MKNRLPIITIAVLSVAGVVGGIVIATTGGTGSAQSAGAVPPMAVTQANPAGPAPTPTSKPAATATVRTAMARVGGVVEAILVNDKGLPLYTYQPDTATQSMVTGELAALWPPLVGHAPTESGTSGTLGVVLTGNGRQVTYNGHFLYTFAEDSPGQVTGQGVENFYVATPSMAPIHSASPSPTRSTTPAPSTPAYGY